MTIFFLVPASNGEVESYRRYGVEEFGKVRVCKGLRDGLMMIIYALYVAGDNRKLIKRIGLKLVHLIYGGERWYTPWGGVSFQKNDRCSGEVKGSGFIHWGFHHSGFIDIYIHWAVVFHVLVSESCIRFLYTNANAMAPPSLPPCHHQSSSHLPLPSPFLIDVVCFPGLPKTPSLLNPFS